MGPATGEKHYASSPSIPTLGPRWVSGDNGELHMPQTSTSRSSLLFVCCFWMATGHEERLVMRYCSICNSGLLRTLPVSCTATFPDTRSKFHRLGKQRSRFISYVTSCLLTQPPSPIGTTYSKTHRFPGLLKVFKWSALNCSAFRYDPSGRQIFVAPTHYRRHGGKGLL